MLSDYAIVKDSAIAGKGLFAQRTIPAHVWIVEYMGTVSSANVEGSDYNLQIGENLFIDGDPWKRDDPYEPNGSYANHSCRPNAEFFFTGGHAFLSSLRDIPQGEEITCNYGPVFFEDISQCRCGDDHSEILVKRKESEPFSQNPGRGYFTQETYLAGGQDPNLLEPEKWWQVLSILLKNQPRVLDVGCGQRAVLANYLRGKGINADGLDFAAPSGPGFYSGDMLHFTPERSYNTVTCFSTLYYFSRSELLPVLEQMWGWFDDFALLYSTTSDVLVDSAAVCAHSPLYLRQTCTKIGGHAAILNLIDEPFSQFGPCIYWSKAPLNEYLQEMFKVSYLLRQNDFYDATVSI